MTGAGLAVILVLVFLAFAALLGATFYVLHRFVTHFYIHAIIAHAFVISTLLTRMPIHHPSLCCPLHRKKKRVEAEEEERDKAIEEAQVYLPR